MKTIFKIFPDDYPENPRTNYDNLGVFAAWHRRYNFGDIHPKEPPSEWLPKNAPEGSVVLTVYMMDHGSLTFRTSPKEFERVDSAHWDWGKLGVIVATPDAIMKWFNVDTITDEIRQKTKEVLENEIHIYDLYQSGQVWGYAYIQEETCPTCGHVETKETDSCWGFIGSTLEETGILDALPTESRLLLKEAWERRYE